MHHAIDRIVHTTTYVTPVVEHWLKREIAQWVCNEGLIRRPITPWANALTTELLGLLNLYPRPIQFGHFQRKERILHSYPLEMIYLTMSGFQNVSDERKRVKYVWKQEEPWCNKGRGMCYPVCGMMHIKEPLLLIGKSSLCGGSGFPLLLSEWSFNICLTPYNRK